jgi:hypothetical protein
MGPTRALGESARQSVGAVPLRPWRGNFLAFCAPWVSMLTVVADLIQQTLKPLRYRRPRTREPISEHTVELMGRSLEFATASVAGTCWAQQLSVSVNSADYMPAAEVSLDLGVAELTENFDPARFFLIDIKNISGKVIKIKETSTAVQPTFWVQGAAISGAFTLSSNQVRTIRVRAKSTVEGSIRARSNGEIPRMP